MKLRHVHECTSVYEGTNKISTQKCKYSKKLGVGLSSTKKVSFTCFSRSHLKLMKNAFYFILKALFVRKIF